MKARRDAINFLADRAGVGVDEDFGFGDFGFGVVLRHRRQSENHRPMTSPVRDAIGRSMALESIASAKTQRPRAGVLQELFAAAKDIDRPNLVDDGIHAKSENRRCRIGAGDKAGG